jgi:hypothetical protein
MLACDDSLEKKSTDRQSGSARTTMVEMALHLLQGSSIVLVVYLPGIMDNFREVVPRSARTLVVAAFFGCCATHQPALT